MKERKKNRTQMNDKGQEMNFRFRVYIHYGDANEGKVGQHYHDFINPPSVVIE